MMQTQPRGGHIFNIDGAGSDGRPTPRSDFISCASKCILSFFVITQHIYEYQTLHIILCRRNMISRDIKASAMHH